MRLRLATHTFFFILILTGSLINDSFFGPPAQFASFVFVLTAFVFILFSALNNFLPGSQVLFSPQNRPVARVNFLPVLAWLTLTGYYLVLAAGGSGSHFAPVHYYWLCLALLLIQLSLEFAVQPLFFRAVCGVIMLGAIAESCLCLLQYVGALPSMNPLFKVTGSWINPNVTGMFLAMSVPAGILMASKGKLVARSVAIFSLVTAVPAIGVLGTRSAAAGIGAGLVVMAAIFFRRIGRIPKRLKPGTILIIFSLVTLASLAGYAVYRLKPDSSAGRLLIWKVSLMMFGDRPFFAGGLGTFEHDYNLRQAGYFKGGIATDKEVHEASYVQVAYNEYLSNTLEGGLPGFLLFTFFVLGTIASSSSVPWRKSPGDIKGDIKGDMKKGSRLMEDGERVVALGGIVCWSVMSLVNFTINAIPVTVVFFVYVARFLQRQPDKERGAFAWSLPFSPRLVQALDGIVISGLAAILLFMEVRQAFGYRQAATAQRMARQGYLKEAANIEEALEDRMSSCRWYWMEYGNILFGMHNYKEACKKYLKAVSLSSNPDYYYYLGNCYFKLDELNEAEDAWSTARNIQPNRFMPRLALMRLYAYRKDTLHALNCAYGIVDLQPKIPSLRTDSCKKEAQRLISQLHI